MFHRSQQSKPLTGPDLLAELDAATASYRAQVKGIVADAKDRQITVADQISTLRTEQTILQSVIDGSATSAQ